MEPGPPTPLDAPLAAETGGKLGGRVLLSLLVTVPLAAVSERAGWPASVSFLLAVAVGSPGTELEFAL